MLPVLQIGPLSLPTAAILLLTGFWIGLELAEKQSHALGADSATLNNMTLAALVAGILGARLGYAAQAPQAFLESPLSLLALTPQMLDPVVGIAAAVAAALVYIRISEKPLWPALDAAVGLLSVLSVALGLAHFASGSAFGAPADLPWAIDLWGERRHPAQVYETLAALLVAAVVWPRSTVGRRWRDAPGLRFWTFLALSAGARLIIESFRGDSTLWLNTFRAAQAAAWLVLAVSLWQIGRRQRPEADDPAPDAPETGQPEDRSQTKAADHEPAR